MHERIGQMFPVKAGCFSLSHVDTEVQDGRVFATLQLFCFEEAGGLIRDVKEQRVLIAKSEAAVLRDSFGAFCEAYREVLARVFEASPEKIEVRMPHDLIFADVPSLDKPKTKEQFVRALSTKGRLGKLLGAQKPVEL